MILEYALIDDIFLKYDLTLSDIKNMCKSSRIYSKYCKENINYILKKMIIKYDVSLDILYMTDFFVRPSLSNYYNLLDYYFKNLYYKESFNMFGYYEYKFPYLLFLKKLSIFNNNNLPKVNNVPNLEILICSNCNLSNIPNYSNLKILDCSNNQLTNLPKFINLIE